MSEQIDIVVDLGAVATPFLPFDVGRWKLDVRVCIPRFFCVFRLFPPFPTFFDSYITSRTLALVRQ